jgi:hypothetical protein
MDFRSAIRYCEPARSKDETRGHLQDFLTLDGCVVTTDGHRLHIAVVDDVDLAERRVFHPDGIEMIAHGKAPQDAYPVEQDCYPDVGQIVQSAFGCGPKGRRVRVVGSEFHNALNAVMPEKPKREKRITSAPRVRKPKPKRGDPTPPKPSVTLEFLEDEIEICGPFDEDAQRKARRVYAHNVEGTAGLRLIFDAKYLIAAVKGMQVGRIEFTVNEELGPIGIESEDLRAVVMPMRP